MKIVIKHPEKRADIVEAVLEFLLFVFGGLISVYTQAWLPIITATFLVFVLDILYYNVFRTKE